MAVSSAAGVRAESTRRWAGDWALVRRGSGASSSTTWALVPPIPNELTPARRGWPSHSQARRRVFTKNGELSKSMFGLGLVKWRLGGSSPCRSESTVLMKPATPAAASVWPMLVLTDPIAQ